MEGFILVRVLGTMHPGMEAMVAGREAVGHIAFAVRKQREMNAVLSPWSPLYSAQDPVHGMGYLGG